MIDNLPTICIVGIFLLLGLGLLRLREFRGPMTEREWSRRYRKQRRELQRLRDQGTP